MKSPPLPTQSPRCGDRRAAEQIGSPRAYPGGRKAAPDDEVEADVDTRQHREWAVIHGAHGFADPLGILCCATATTAPDSDFVACECVPPPTPRVLPVSAGLAQRQSDVA